jgi:amino acid adenylation domain-containing protein
MTSLDMDARQNTDAPDDPVALAGLLALGTGTSLSDVDFVPVHELVAAHAVATPDRVAVLGGGGSAPASITYRELDEWAGRVAAGIGAAIGAGGDPGAGGELRVGLLAEPSVAMIAAALGALRAGVAYVPVDVSQPDRRIAEILADAEVAAVVVTTAGAGRLAGLGRPIVDVEVARSSPEAGAAPPVPVGRADAAYLIYTSGSTGEPKGVLVEHGQLAASTLARRRVYPGSPVFLLVSPLAFDSSVAGLWGTLTAGGTLVVASADDVRDPQALVELVDRHRVTQLLCVPSLYSVLLDAAARVGTAALGSLETVIVAGESLPLTLLARHFTAHAGPVALVNEYGPTETTVWASYRRYDAPGPVSIGGPVPGTRLYVLDEHLRPVPRGAEGELFVGGAGVSRGYFGRADATARAFLGDPFDPSPGARMYRTGDRARWTADGVLDFVGRRDHQVKIRGHRIELGAVEEALRTVPGVDDAAVVTDAHHTRLVGFVVCSAGLTEADITGRLGSVLPRAMVPADIHLVDVLPRTFRGKVDRARLRAEADRPVGTVDRPIRTDGTADRATDVTAGTLAGDLEVRVAAAWAEVLRRVDIPLDANFFDLGGHSLAMFRLQDALERQTGVRPSVVALFRHTTVSAQAGLIRGGGTDAVASMASSRQSAAREARELRARRLRAERKAS